MALGLVLLTPAAEAKAPSVQWRLKLKAGPEYDSNAGRLSEGEGDPFAERSNRQVVRDGLARFYLSLPARIRLPHRQLARLEYSGGAKLFFNESAENTLANRGLVGWQWGATKWLILRADGLVKHRVLKVNDRGYTWLDGGVGATVRLPARVLLSLRVGARHYETGADQEGIDDFDYDGAAGSVSVLWRAKPWLDANLFWRPELRDFTGPGDERRQVAGFNVTLRRKILLTAGYQATFGDREGTRVDRDFFRHRVTALLTLRLPWEISANLDLAVQWSDERISLVENPDQDENWNKAVVTLSRPLGGGFSLELVAAGYANSFGPAASGQPDFSRYTLFAGPAWRR